MEADEVVEEDESLAMVLDPVAVALAQAMAEEDARASTDRDSSGESSSGAAVRAALKRTTSGIGDKSSGPSLFFSPRDLFTVHLSEDEKRTVVFKADTPLRAILERVCFARGWDMSQCLVRSHYILQTHAGP